MSEDETIRRILQGLDWTGPVTPPLDERARTIKHSLGEGALRWMAGTVEEGCGQLAQKDGADMLAPWSRIRTLAHEIVASMLLELLGVPPTGPDTPRSLDRGLAEDIVSRDIEVADIVGALRVMQDLWMSLLVRSALAIPDGAAVVPRLVRTVTGAVDRCVDTLVAAIAEERRLVLQHGRARVRRMIEALVEGRLPEEQAASDTLGVSMGGWHLGCVIHAPPGAALDRGQVDAVAAAFGDATGGGPLTRYETGAGQVWLWKSGHRPVPTPTTDDLHIPSPVVVGMGESRRGLTGFRRTHMEASEALRIGLMLEANGHGHRYRDVGLAALLSQDAERARWFVDSELRDLAADTPEMRELRHTLRVFFDAQMRVAPAADRLYIHRNTLRDRLRRIERMLGYRLAERSAECQAALQLSELDRLARTT